MHHKIERIASKPQDYKTCKECGCTNLYENGVCHSFGSSNFQPADASVLLNLFHELPGLEMEV